MTRTSISRGDFRAILKQAKREQAAQDAGFLTHADQVEDHRAKRREKLQKRREALRARCSA